MRALMIAVAALIWLTGCAVLGMSALQGETLRADEDEVDYIRAHDRPAYITIAITHGNVVKGMTREDVRFVKGPPRDSIMAGDKVTWSYGPVTRRERVVFEGETVVDVR